MIPYFASRLSKLSGTIPSASVTIDITVTLMFHCFLVQLFVSLFTYFTLVLNRDNKICLTASSFIVNI